MPQSLDNVLIQIVFSVKNREPLLGKRVRPELFAYVDRVVHRVGCVCLKVGGIEDHVHLAVRLGRTVEIAKLVERVKTSTSQWLKSTGADRAHFAWQRGYGVFSIGHRDLPALLSYVDGQEEHHKALSFEDEYRLLLKAHGIEGDERHMWD
jgi:putative transposase